MKYKTSRRNKNTYFLLQALIYGLINKVVCKYRRTPVSADSVSAVDRGPKKFGKLKT
jgi:hypothetical protein